MQSVNFNAADMCALYLRSDVRESFSRLPVMLYVQRISQQETNRSEMLYKAVAVGLNRQFIQNNEKKNLFYVGRRAESCGQEITGKLQGHRQAGHVF